MAVPAAGAMQPPDGLRPTLPDRALLDRIDAFIDRERSASGIPGVAIAVVHAGRIVHARGFGHDGRGHAIDADTPFPIGSLTKSFTTLLVRQAVEAGQLDPDSPVQRYLPWFRVADPQASARITLRHLLNQTSGLSRAGGMAPLLDPQDIGIEALARSLASEPLERPVGSAFEYSNLNVVVLAAVLEAVTGQRWQDMVQQQVFVPAGMAHAHTDLAAAETAGMTRLHRMWFGLPIAARLQLPAALQPAGGLAASAGDMARYLQVLLAQGAGPSSRVLSAAGVAQWLAPATPPARAMLLSTEFDFRYAEGWFAGPFGAAADARWHVGHLASFAAWMVLLPATQQAVVVLINANSELPFNNVNAVMSRLPIGVVNLLAGQPVPQGPSLREAYRPFNLAAALIALTLGVLAWRATRARRALWAGALISMATASVVVLQVLGLEAALHFDFAPDLALSAITMIALACLPAALRTWAWAQRK